MAKTCAINDNTGLKRKKDQGRKKDKKTISRPRKLALWWF
jgi:hypothetical protein